MKKTRRIIALLSAAALFLSSTGMVMAETALRDDGQARPAVSSEASQMVKDADYVKDQVIVVFNGNVPDSKIKAEIKKEDAKCLKISEVADSSKVAVADINKNDSVEETITKLDENSKVQYAQPNYKYQPAATDPYNNDQGLNQWYLSNIKARDAWASAGAAGNLTKPVTVAVIDTGADMNHEDLRSNLSSKSAKVDAGKVETLKKDADYEGHGTHTSGIIGAVANNGKGIAGIASGIGNDAVKLLAIDATAQYGGELFFDTYNIVSAIKYAAEQGAKVINMSFGGYSKDQVVEDAVKDAYDQKITMVAAAGNDNTKEYASPSDLGEVISVCNVTKENRRYVGENGSNYGQAKDISAPGINILSTVPGGYGRMSGTSMSAPMVSAAAAMLYAVNPDLTAFQVKNILCGTAYDPEGDGFDYYTGYGVVDVNKAIQAAVSAQKDTAVESIAWKEDSKYKKCLYVDESEVLEVLIKPAISLAKVNWSSSDPDTVSVDANGRITGQKVGSAIIRCEAGGKTADQKVYVNESNAPVSVRILNADKASKLSVGGGLYLDASVKPVYADRADVYWKSSDPKVATVDETGYLEARSPGEADIIAYTYNSQQKDPKNPPEAYDLTAVMHVDVSAAVSKVTLVSPQTKLKLGSSYTFKATTVPSGALDSQVSWSSSNRSVASIDKNTGKLTTVGAGRCTIKAVTKNGKSASVRITVFKTTYSGSSYGLTATPYSYQSNKLSWKSIPNADGYEIWRSSKGSSYSKIKTVGGTTLSYTNSKLRTGTKYTYKIKAYYKIGNTPYYCGYSTAKSAVPSLKAAKVKTKSSKKRITLSWSKVSGASRYVVYKYSKDKKKYVKKKTQKGRTYTDKKVSKGKKYSYKVRAYRTVNGKRVYGPYSKRVSRVCR